MSTLSMNSSSASLWGKNLDDLIEYEKLQKKIN